MLELFIYLAILSLAITAFVYIVLPIGSLVALLFGCAGTAIGAYSAIKSYVQSIASNINPYDYYVDLSPDRQEHAARRSYFFGPGYAQLQKTVKDAWQGIGDGVKRFAVMRDNLIRKFDNLMVKIAAWFLYLCAAATVGLVGGALTGVLSMLHAMVLTAFMSAIYVLFSAVWLVDRLYLGICAIAGNCPHCQTRSVVPSFVCPQCGEVHTKLVPGPYGILHRECTCGRILPTTFLMGRSNLTASCPVCGRELAASDAQQFALTMVGGTSSGKTVLLSSFFHELFREMDGADVSYRIPSIHRTMFKDLEDWFGGTPCPATPVSDTSDMYSVLLTSDRFTADKQFSLYDIAGEVFNDSSLYSMLPQQQMRDSDGVVIVIDPLSALKMREQAKIEGDDTLNFSSAEAASVVTNFVTYLKNVLTNGKTRVKSQKPVAVVITKTDLSSISRRISYHRIQNVMRANPDAFDSFDEARDQLSREFLSDIGLQDAVKTIEAAFSEVHYFPVSAMGHITNGEEFEPEHVLEPFHWLISHTQPELASALGVENKVS